MPYDFVENITLASSLHDIGKVAIADSILLKPGPLTSEEFDIMKTHTSLGAQMLCGSRHTVIRMAESIAMNHHERWDGSGYPNEKVMRRRLREGSSCWRTSMTPCAANGPISP